MKYIYLLFLFCLFGCTRTTNKQSNIKNIYLEQSNIQDFIGLPIQLTTLDSVLFINDFYGDSLIHCISLKDNYFERNRLTFRSRSQLIAYITQEIEQGRNKLYFRIDGLFPKLRRSELAGMVAKIAAGGQSRAVKVQQIPNEKVGTYWIRIY